MATKLFEVKVNYKGVAALLASASLITGSPTLIDRVANALSVDSVIKSINDALRVVESYQKSGKENITEKDGRTEITIDREQYPLFAKLCTTEQLREFLEDVQRDIRIARAVAALAESLILDARRVQPEGENS
jgi:CRISPR type I-A-associated protein Csa5